MVADRAHGDPFGLCERFQIRRYPNNRIGSHKRPQLRDRPLGIFRLNQHILAAQERHTGSQIGELFGGDGGKAGDSADGKPPALGQLSGIGLLRLRENPLDRIPEPLGGASAKGLIGIVPLDVFE